MADQPQGPRGAGKSSTAGVPQAGAAGSLALLRAEYARLAAAARATVAAASAGEHDPVAYLRAELSRHGGLPPRDARVTAVLADAAGAMRVAGRAAQGQAR